MDGVLQVKQEMSEVVFLFFSCLTASSKVKKMRKNIDQTGVALHVSAAFLNVF